MFAQYVRPGELPPPTRVPALASGVHIDGGRVQLVRKVIQGGETLGTIYLRAQYDVMSKPGRSASGPFSPKPVTSA